MATGLQSGVVALRSFEKGDIKTGICKMTQALGPIVDIGLPGVGTALSVFGGIFGGFLNGPSEVQLLKEHLDERIDKLEENQKIIADKIDAIGKDLIAVGKKIVQEIHGVRKQLNGVERRIIQHVTFTAQIQTLKKLKAQMRVGQIEMHAYWDSHGGSTTQKLRTILSRMDNLNRDAGTFFPTDGASSIRKMLDVRGFSITILEMMQSIVNDPITEIGGVDPVQHMMLDRSSLMNGVLICVIHMQILVIERVGLLNAVGCYTEARTDLRFWRGIKQDCLGWWAKYVELCIPTTSRSGFGPWFSRRYEIEEMCHNATSIWPNYRFPNEDFKNKKFIKGHGWFKWSGRVFYHKDHPRHPYQVHHQWKGVEVSDHLKRYMPYGWE